MKNIATNKEGSGQFKFSCCNGPNLMKHLTLEENLALNYTVGQIIHDGKIIHLTKICQEAQKA